MHLQIANKNAVSEDKIAIHSCAVSRPEFRSSVAVLESGQWSVVELSHSRLHSREHGLKLLGDSLIFKQVHHSFRNETYDGKEKS